MKTSTNEVTCDGCGRAIPAMHPTARFVTMRGPNIGHLKRDFHDVQCLLRWAIDAFGPKYEAASPEQLAPQQWWISRRPGEAAPLPPPEG